jgi:histone deacetylase 6
MLLLLQAAFELVLEPIIADFDPELVIISAGFDAVEGDPLGGCKVTPAGFAAMTHRLLKFAKGKMVAVLEGGYRPR